MSFYIAFQNMKFYEEEKRKRKWKNLNLKAERS